MKSLLISLLLCSAAACGNSGEATDPGTGTATLAVNGSVTAQPAVANSGDPTTFTSDFEVRIQKAGQDVTTGTVTITSDGGTVTLVYTGDANRWRGAQAGYYQSYGLDITSGDDSVSGARVDGPDIQTFTAPLPGANVDSTMPLAVKWDRNETADEATLSTHNLDRVTIPDSGSYSLAMGTLRSKPDETQDEQLELVRTDLVALKGAAAGSSFQVSVIASIDLVVLPNPTP